MLTDCVRDAALRAPARIAADSPKVVTTSKAVQIEVIETMLGSRDTMKLVHARIVARGEASYIEA